MIQNMILEEEAEEDSFLPKKKNQRNKIKNRDYIMIYITRTGGTTSIALIVLSSYRVHLPVLLMSLKYVVLENLTLAAKQMDRTENFRRPA
jgi:predicted membrane channel-forming protein YqfA (hemolysin III family)